MLNFLFLLRENRKSNMNYDIFCHKLVFLDSYYKIQYSKGVMPSVYHLCFWRYDPTVPIYHQMVLTNYRMDIKIVISVLFSI